MPRQTLVPTPLSSVQRGMAISPSMHPWLDPLYDAAEMRAVDAWAIGPSGFPRST